MSDHRYICGCSEAAGLCPDHAPRMLVDEFPNGMIVCDDGAVFPVEHPPLRSLSEVEAEREHYRQLDVEGVYSAPEVSQ